MTQIICLANSIRPGGRCIAGKDLKTGEWIRPVNDNSNRAIPNSFTLAKSLKLMDIVEIPLKSNVLSDKYQRENRLVDNWSWNIVGRATIGNVIKLCESNAQILHNDIDHVDATDMDLLPMPDWKSLQLIQTQVQFVPDSYDNSRWRAEFQDGLGNDYSLKVTDPDFDTKLRSGSSVSSDCILCISLPEPWKPDTGNQPLRSYKLVAGVIEL